MFLVKDYLVGEVEVKENYKDCDKSNSFLLNREEGKSYLVTSYYNDDLCDVDYYKIEINEEDLYLDLDSRIVVKFDFSNQKEKISEYIDYLVKANMQYSDNEVKSLFNEISFEDVYYAYDVDKKAYNPISKEDLSDKDIVVLGLIRPEFDGLYSESCAALPSYNYFNLLLYVNIPTVDFNGYYPKLDKLVLKEIPLVNLLKINN